MPIMNKNKTKITVLNPKPKMTLSKNFISLDKKKENRKLGKTKRNMPHAIFIISKAIIGIDNNFLKIIGAFSQK